MGLIHKDKVFEIIEDFCFGNTEEGIEVKRALKEEINQLDVLFDVPKQEGVTDGN